MKKQKVSELKAIILTDIIHQFNDRDLVAFEQESKRIRKRRIITYLKKLFHQWDTLNYYTKEIDATLDILIEKTSHYGRYEPSLAFQWTFILNNSRAFEVKHIEGKSYGILADIFRHYGWTLSKTFYNTLKLEPTVMNEGASEYAEFQDFPFAHLVEKPH